MTLELGEGVGVGRGAAVDGLMLGDGSSAMASEAVSEGSAPSRPMTTPSAAAQLRTAPPATSFFESTKRRYGPVGRCRADLRKLAFRALAASTGWVRGSVRDHRFRRIVPRRRAVSRVGPSPGHARGARRL